MSSLNVCRLCLVESSASFAVLTKTSTLVETIYKATSIQVLSNETDNVLLCENCQFQLTQFESFRELCLQNDEIYRQRLADESHIKTENASDDELNDIKMVIVRVDETQQRELIDESELHLMKEEQPDDTEESDHTNTNVPNASLKKSKPRAARIRKKHKIIDEEPQIEPDDTRVEQSKRPNPPTTRSSCAECGKMIRNCNMKRHLESHDPVVTPQYSCAHCGKHYRNSHLLKAHINSNHTFEQKYDCNECGKFYYSPKSLKVHFNEKHSLEERFKCKECGEKFTSFSKKKLHFLKEHTNEKRYTCQFCGKGFKIGHDLTLHVRTHTGEKPFACDICGKKFSKSYNVVIHKKSHRNDEERKQDVRTKCVTIEKHKTNVE
uniref:Protein krueppel n=1 Tax=Anopheles dirus TaxID=7168 RepID=A0A182NW89_9DIPT